MANQSMWVHGHSATIQLEHLGRGPGEDVGGRPWTAVEGLRMGRGVEYRCQDGSDYWFHFSIPTPAIDDGVTARFRQVMILFTAYPGVTLNAIHVCYGPNNRFKIDTSAVGGPNLSLVNGRNSFVSPPPGGDDRVFFGVGISALFHFADAGNVTLHAASVRFES